MGQEVLPCSSSMAAWDAVAAGDVIEDALHEDDADVDAAGDVGEELVDEVVDGVEGVAGEDAGDGGGSVGMNAGDVEVGELGADGVGKQGGVVGHRFAAVAARDDGAGDGIDEAPGEGAWGMRK